MRTKRIPRDEKLGERTTLAGALAPARITAWLFTFTIMIVAACAVAGIARFKYGIDRGPLFIVPLFDLDEEQSIPNWYSSLLLFTAAVVVAAIGLIHHRRRERFGRHWLGLAVLFVLLSLDEAVSIHERTMSPLRKLIRAEGVFYYPWVIPASVIVAVLGIMYLRFVLALPSRSRRLCTISAFIYVAGAIGMEMVSGVYASRHGDQTASYALLAGVEETLEMCGSILFIYTLLDYIRARWGEFSVSFQTAAQSDAATTVSPVTTTPSDSQLPDRAEPLGLEEPDPAGA